MEFGYHIEEQDGVNIIHLTGNLIEKYQGNSLFEDIEHLILKDSQKFVLDMTGLEYLNSTGINVLITILTRARKASGEAVMCCVPKRIKDMLLITKLNTIFMVTESMKEAVKKLEIVN